MTAAERLKQLSGLAGVSAAMMLLAISTGATASDLLVNYSKLSSGTAAEHLLVDASIVEQVAAKPKLVITNSVSGLNTKLHLAELSKLEQVNKDLKFKNELIRQDEELLTIISFMVANRIIV